MLAHNRASLYYFRLRHICVSNTWIARVCRIQWSLAAGPGIFRRWARYGRRVRSVNHMRWLRMVFTNVLALWRPFCFCSNTCGWSPRSLKSLLREWFWVEFQPAPTSWPWALSEEFGPVGNDWGMGLWCFGVCRYCGKSINKCVAEPRPLKWINKRVFNAWDNPAAPVDFHPASWRKIQLWYLTLGNMPRLHISPIEVNSQWWSLLVIKITANNLRLQSGMPWLVTFRAPPWWMLGGIPPSITAGGVSNARGKYAGLVPLWLLKVARYVCGPWWSKSVLGDSTTELLCHIKTLWRLWPSSEF